MYVYVHIQGLTVRWSGKGVYVHGLDVRVCAYTRVVNGSM